jgi:hypothetical protein
MHVFIRDAGRRRFQDRGFGLLGESVLPQISKRQQGPVWQAESGDEDLSVYASVRSSSFSANHFSFLGLDVVSSAARASELSTTAKSRFLNRGVYVRHAVSGKLGAGV